MDLVGVKEGYVNSRMQGKVHKRALENDKKVSKLGKLTYALYLT